jgi:hypothetical protein
MTSAMTATDSSSEQPYQRTDGPIHSWFGLTYANYLVLHRALLQSMPLRWQREFVNLLEELDAAYPRSGRPDFEVATVRDCYVGELTDSERRALGITTGGGDDPGCGDADEVYYDRQGNEMSAYDHVGVPVPDPVPHYNRGRTYLPPDEDAIAAVRAHRAREEGTEQPGGDSR